MCARPSCCPPCSQTPRERRMRFEKELWYQLRPDRSIILAVISGGAPLRSVTTQWSVISIMVVMHWFNIALFRPVATLGRVRANVIMYYLIAPCVSMCGLCLHVRASSDGHRIEKCITSSWRWHAVPMDCQRIFVTVKLTLNGDFFIQMYIIEEFWTYKVRQRRTNIW